MITGRDLNEMREALGMTAAHFGLLMCVGIATPYRWARKKFASQEVDGFPRVLGAMWKAGRPSKAVCLKMGEAFVATSVRSGQFTALHEFMGALMRSPKCRG